MNFLVVILYLHTHYWSTRELLLRGPGGALDAGLRRLGLRAGCVDAVEEESESGHP